MRKRRPGPSSHVQPDPSSACISSSLGATVGPLSLARTRGSRSPSSSTPAGATVDGKETEPGNPATASRQICIAATDPAARVVITVQRAGRRSTRQSTSLRVGNRVVERDPRSFSNAGDALTAASMRWGVEPEVFIEVSGAERPWWDPRALDPALGREVRLRLVRGPRAQFTSDIGFIRMEESMHWPNSLAAMKATYSILGCRCRILRFDAIDNMAHEFWCKRCDAFFYAPMDDVSVDTLADAEIDGGMWP